MKCRDSLQQAAQELSILEKAYENLSTFNSKFLVAQPLGIIPSLNALITLEVNGTRLPVFSLKSILKGDTVSILATFEDVGKWLAVFHRVMTGFHRTRSIQSFTSSLKASLKNFLTDDLVEREFFNTIDERLSHEIRKFSNVGEVELVFSHGDFLPRHVFVGSKTLTVIDYDNICVAPCYFDLSYFITYLYNSFFLLSSRSLIERSCRAFLKGYFGADQLPDNVQASVNAATIVRMAQLYRQACIRRGTTQMFFIRPWFRERARAVLEDYSKGAFDKNKSLKKDQIESQESY
jgi:Ser/Thr protein kinase RdoA (MazF antagonist)